LFLFFPKQMNLPTAQGAHYGVAMTNHAELIKFLEYQQQQIELLGTRVCNLQSAYDLLRGSRNDARLRVTLDSPKEKRPALAVGQRWKRRDGKVVTIDRSDAHHGPCVAYPFWAGEVSYTSSGQWSTDGSLRPYDLIELLPPPASGLQWTVRRSNSDCKSMHHVAETPIGQFLIAWVIGEESDYAEIQKKPPVNAFTCSAWKSVNDAKAECQSAFDECLEACAALSTPTESSP
jgi:hypothetical protein